MSREVKIFTSSVEQTPEPFPFQLKFTRKLADGAEETELHEFEALGDPGAGAQFAMTSILRFDDKGRQQVNLSGMLTFFERVLPPEQYTELTTLLDRQDLTIPIDMIGDVFRWLVEEYSGRPTRRLSVYSDGQPETGKASTAKRSSVAATS